MATSLTRLENLAYYDFLPRGEPVEAQAWERVMSQELHGAEAETQLQSGLVWFDPRSPLPPVLDVNSPEMQQGMKDVAAITREIFGVDGTMKEEEDYEIAGERFIAVHVVDLDDDVAAISARSQQWHEALGKLPRNVWWFFCLAIDGE